MNVNKFLRFLMIAIVLFTQVMFLAVIARSHYETNNITIIAVIALFALSLLLGHKYLELHDKEYSYEKLSIAIWAPIGALACHLLNVKMGLGSVLAAGIVGGGASFIPLLDKKSVYFAQLPVVIYCGAFVGMSSAEIIPSSGFVILAGTLAGLFLLLSKKLFVGMGGKLGTMAFLGVLIVYLINLI